MHPLESMYPFGCERMCRQILWPVRLEVLKTKDVKQTNGQEGQFRAAGHLLIYDTVDFLNNPREQLIVDGLRKYDVSFR